MNASRRTAEHVVYRLYGADGLLYIGATSNLTKRLRHHKARTPWFGEVTRVEHQAFPNRIQAFAAEIEAIREEQPPRNVVGTERAARRTERTERFRAADGHGYVRYASGCRCETCKGAKADYMRERRAAARARAKNGVAVVGINHGSRAGYDEHGCRCLPCSEAKVAARMRETPRWGRAA